MVKRKTIRKKKMSGGTVVLPETSGYKLNEGIGGMNDPRTGLESSRLIVGGKKRRTRKSTKKRRRTQRKK